MRVTSEICVLVGLSLLIAQSARADMHQRSLFTGDEEPIGIAVDSQGRIHLSWDSSRVRPNYMRIGGGKTVKQEIDPTPQFSISGQRTAISEDSTGSPQIAYWSQHGGTVMGALFYAHPVGAGWQLEQIGQQGFPLAMATNTHDQPRIIAADGFTGTYVHLEDGGWQSEALPFVFNSITSLALDSTDHAHLGVNIAGHPSYLTNSSGSWVATQLDPDFAWSTSVALDSLEHPHAAMALPEVGTIRVRRFDGAEWQTEDVYDPNSLPDGITNAPQTVALALDAKDRPRVLFVTQLTVSRVRHGFATSDQIDALIYGYHDGVEWRLIPVANSVRMEHWTRLVIDPSGVSQGAYALRTPPFFENQGAKLVSIALPDVTGEWSSLSVTPQGDKLRVQGVLTLRNDGPGRSRAAPIALAFSNDAVLDLSDTAVAIKKSAPALAPGQTKTVPVSFLQAGPLPATQLIAVIDPAGKLDDLDRANNTIAAELPQ